jgi:hypothetical protein
MARTEVLKTIIQPELAASFLLAHNAIEIKPRRLLGMEPDLVAYSAADGVLWICEITTSGFLGKGNANFHVGASRKFCEGFAKFSIVTLKADEAKQHISIFAENPRVDEARLECRFVVPKDSRFIQALGWRGQLAGTVMRIEEVALTAHSREQMIEALLSSRAEQEQQRGTLAVVSDSGTIVTPATVESL